MKTKHTQFLKWLEQKAERDAMSAALSGAWSDDGARQVHDEIACFRAGLEDTIPDIWTEHYQEFARETDPDYVKYKELKKKFEK